MPKMTLDQIDAEYAVDTREILGGMIEFGRSQKMSDAEIRQKIIESRNRMNIAHLERGERPEWIARATAIDD